MNSDSIEQEASFLVVDTDHRHYRPTSTAATSTTTTTTSEEDERVRRLEASGALQLVVGSQSILSQELLCSDDGDDDSNRNNYDDHDNVVVLSQEGDKNQDSNEKEMTPAKAAQRYGLLTQDDDDDDNDNNNNNSDLIKSNGYQRGQPNDLFDAHHQNEQAPPLVYQRPLHHHHHLEEEKKEEECNVDEESILGQSQPPLSQETLKLSSAANLGSLLDAIQHIEEFGESTSFVCSQQQQQQQQTTRKMASAKPKSSRTRKRSSTTRTAAATTAASNKRRRVTASPHTLKSSQTPASRKHQPKKRKGGASPPATPLPHTSTTAISLDENLAQGAAELAARAINDQDLSKKLLLSMALRRTSPRTAPEKLPGPGHILEDGFFWAHYPPLEKVLKQHMEEYYRLSMSKCQSAQQQSFNNSLVEVVRKAAEEQGWTFDQIYFNDKDLRDRIRCYYKTHIQNAKKRLNTMLRNPSKRSNAVHLMQHFDLIKSTLKEEQNVVAATASSSSSSSTAKSSPGKGSRRNNNRAGKKSSRSSSSSILSQQQHRNIFYV